MKLKILVIHTQYNHYGGEDAVVSQEIQLLKENHIVESLIFKNEIGLKGLFQFFCSIWNSKVAEIINSKISVFKPDIVHLHNWHFAIGPLLIRKIKKNRIPIIVTLHNYRLLCPSATLTNNGELFLESLNEKFTWTAIQNKVYKNSYILTFWLALITWIHTKIKTWHKVDFFICLTQSMKDYFKDSKLKIDESKILIKPHFVFGSKNQDTLKRENHFLFVGRLSKEKGIDLLIEAFKNLPNKLKIIGDGPMREFIETSAINNKNITYLGQLSRDEVSSELKKADALINPSVCLETFGLVIIEAFSNQCSVITSDIGGPKSIVSNGINGLHFKSGDVDDLKRQIVYWSDLNELNKNKIRKVAFDTYLNFYSPEKQLELFEYIYKKSIKKATIKQV